MHHLDETYNLKQKDVHLIMHKDISHAFTFGFASIFTRNGYFHFSVNTKRTKL